MNFNKTVTAQDNLNFNLAEAVNKINELKKLIDSLKIAKSESPVIYIERLYINGNDKTAPEMTSESLILSDYEGKCPKLEGPKNDEISTKKTSANSLSDDKLFKIPLKNADSELEKSVLRANFNLGTECKLKPSEGLQTVSDFELVATEVIKVFAYPSNGYLEYRKNDKKHANKNTYALAAICTYAFNKAGKCEELVGRNKRSFLNYIIKCKLQLDLNDYIDPGCGYIKTKDILNITIAARNYLEQHNLSY